MSLRLTRRQVRAIDRYAIETLGVAGVVLMENAGRGAADVAERFAQQRALHHVAVVAGGGNNGGDGFVIARHLAMRGLHVVVFLAADETKLTPDAAVNLGILRRLARDIRQVDDPAGLGGELRSFDLIIDAIGGTGITGPLYGRTAAVVEQVNAAGRPVLAVDIPTGLDCDSGEAPGSAVRATLTVTFVARKVGFDAPGAGAWTGEVIVADIGVPAEIVAELAGRGG